jgi:hypothetical protein
MPFFCCLTSETFAQLRFSNTELQAYQCYEKFDFKAANLLLTNLKEPKITSILLENYSDFLQLLFSENEKLYSQLIDNEAIRLLKLEKFENDTTFLMCQAEIKLQWAFIHLKFGHEWQAFQGVRQSFKLLKESEKLYPNFIAPQKSLGLLYILLSAVPEQYQWALSVFGLTGNEKLGVNYLQNVAKQKTENSQISNSSNSFYAKEAQFILLLTQTLILKQTENALITVQNYELDKKLLSEKENLLQTIILSWTYLKLGRAKKLINLTSQPILESKKNTLPLLYYFYAEALLLTNDLIISEKYYTYYLNLLQNNSSNTSQENLYIKDCYYKLFLIYYLSNNITKAKESLLLILLKGNLKTAADRYANNFAKKNVEKLVFIHKDLLVVRLLTDGGEYETALEKLIKIDTNNLQVSLEKAEYYYRKARILHKQKKYQMALNHYQIVVDLHSKNAQTYNNCSYFIPNSCLQIALLHKDIFRNNEKAKYYAKLVDGYQDYDYQKSIQQEAKQLLRKL